MGESTNEQKCLDTLLIDASRCRHECMKMNLARSNDNGPPMFLSKVAQSPPSTYSNTMHRCFCWVINNILIIINIIIKIIIITLSEPSSQNCSRRRQQKGCLWRSECPFQQKLGQPIRVEVFFLHVFMHIMVRNLTHTHKHATWFLSTMLLLSTLFMANTCLLCLSLTKYTALCVCVCVCVCACMCVCMCLTIMMHSPISSITDQLDGLKILLTRLRCCLPLVILSHDYVIIIIIFFIVVVIAVMKVVFSCWRCIYRILLLFDRVVWCKKNTNLKLIIKKKWW